ncbi:MAG: hypothetical protein ACREU5_02300 [Burkholderiales bacterium]
MGRRKVIYRASIAVLALGLCAAAAIYLTATDSSAGAVGYEVINGVAYPVAAADSKAYQRELERFGGKANVLAVEFTRWFAGLWQGRRLAFTVAFLGIAASLILFLYARYLEPE